METKTETAPNYFNSHQCLSSDEVIAQAKDILKSRLKVPGQAVNSSQAAADLCILELGDEEVEKFFVMYLDAQYRLIETRILFTGSLTANTVYSREFIKSILDCDAAAVIISHNHPSGNLTPSDADRDMTSKLTGYCKTIEVKLLDHIIVGGAEYYSFSNCGEM